MNIAVIYISRHGTTEKVAEAIKDGISSNVRLINLKKQRRFDLDNYDTVIIGGSIHAGKINNKIKNFCEKNILKLLNKQLALFLCCMDEGDDAIKLFEKSYPEVLRNHSKCNQLVGGEFIMEKMNFIEKAIIKKITGHDRSSSKINYERIEQLILCVNSMGSDKTEKQ